MDPQHINASKHTTMDIGLCGIFKGYERCNIDTTEYKCATRVADL